VLRRHHRSYDRKTHIRSAALPGVIATEDNALDQRRRWRLAVAGRVDIGVFWKARDRQEGKREFDCRFAS